MSYTMMTRSQTRIAKLEEEASRATYWKEQVFSLTLASYCLLKQEKELQARIAELEKRLDFFESMPDLSDHTADLHINGWRHKTDDGWVYNKDDDEFADLKDSDDKSDEESSDEENSDKDTAETIAANNYLKK